jgi:hypothetical protein
MTGPRRTETKQRDENRRRYFASETHASSFVSDSSGANKLTVAPK